MEDFSRPPEGVSAFLHNSHNHLHHNGNNKMAITEKPQQLYISTQQIPSDFPADSRRQSSVDSPLWRRSPFFFLSGRWLQVHLVLTCSALCCYCRACLNPLRARCAWHSQFWSLLLHASCQLFITRWSPDYQLSQLTILFGDFNFYLHDTGNPPSKKKKKNDLASVSDSSTAF